MSLETYNKKRDFKKTLEPSGDDEQQQDDKLIFVIQRHKASHLHYDFRLEIEGVLKSWAVPKGPSLNPQDKRLAMMVEDHPYDYKDFAGVIPAGNYGAGIVEIWDSGTYTSLENKGNTEEDEKLLKAGLYSGNLKFILNGKKLKGEFALVKLKDSESNSWLLIKHRDSFAVDKPYNSEEQTPKNSPINKWLSEHNPEKKNEKKAPKQIKTVSKPESAPKRKQEEFIPAMLAKETDEPFSKENWIFEVKWDGYRAIAEINNKDVKLYSRNGLSFNNTYSIVVEELSKMKINAVLDGEIVVLNEEGNPDFHKLQEYGLNKDVPLQYYVFDLLELNGKKLYSTPLIERKNILSEIIKKNPIIKYSDHIEEAGQEFFEVIKERDLEGIMAKKMDSLYYPGKRTADWLKIKHHKSEDVIIAGFTAPRGGRKYFGALVLGSMVNGKFTYVGHTGSGFDSDLLKELYGRLQPLIREQSPFDEKVKTNMPVTWVELKYVCEVKFSEWTSDGKLRHPIFLRLREDKQPQDLNPQLETGKIEEMNSAESDSQPKKEKSKKAVKKATVEKKDVSETKTAPEVEKKKTPLRSSTKKEKTSQAIEAEQAKPLPEEQAKPSKTAHLNKDVVNNEKEKIYKFGKTELKTTNRTKIFFPDEGITKGDVIDYYEKMADLIIPYIKDRPQSLFRTPNGINQKGFFQKDAGDEAPSWVKHIPLYSDSVKKDIDYILCNDKATLIYLANLGCIEINPWHSKVKSLDNPDYLIIDIDPSDNNTFDQVIEAANVVKEILDKAGAKSICKTSGASGLHVYVPFGKKYNYDQAKDFANLVCMMANQLIPEFTTLERSLTKRSKDKIYMDYLQNRKGQTIACVYSVRPKKGATVSTPLDWSEVKKGLSPQDFTIKTIHERLKKTGDLFAPMLDNKNAIDLAKCLENLSA